MSESWGGSIFIWAILGMYVRFWTKPLVLNGAIHEESNVFVWQCNYSPLGSHKHLSTRTAARFFKVTLFGPISDLHFGNQKVTLTKLEEVIEAKRSHRLIFWGTPLRGSDLIRGCCVMKALADTKIRSDPLQMRKWKNRRCLPIFFWRGQMVFYLVVWTPLKNISQIGHLAQIGVKIKNCLKPAPSFATKKKTHLPWNTGCFNRDLNNGC